MGDGSATLFIADFSDTHTAWKAYEALKAMEDGRHFAIDGVVVVKRDDEGELEIQKATDHSTSRGMKLALIGGAAGSTFPAVDQRQATALGAGGAALGKARQRHRKIGLEKELEDALPRVHSGIVALVSFAVRGAMRGTPRPLPEFRSRSQCRPPTGRVSWRSQAKSRLSQGCPNTTTGPNHHWSLRPEQ